MQKQSFTYWLSLKNNDPFLKNPVFRGFLGFLSVCLALIFVFSSIAITFLFLASIFSTTSTSSTDQSENIRNLGIALTAILGFPFIVWRSVTADKQVRISETSHFDEKVNASASALSSQREFTVLQENASGSFVERHLEDDIVARVAAINNLESLAEERPDSSRNIIALLATYVRGTFPAEHLIPTEDITTRRIPRPDLQRAIEAIGNLNTIARAVDNGEWRIDLSRSNLDGVSFSNGNFFASNLSNCRCEGAIFRMANFEGALFFYSLLNYADFFKTNLRGARLDYCIINRPEPILGGMTESVNFADLNGTTFIGADLSAIDYLGTPEEISKTMGSGDTVVSEELQENMPSDDTHRRGFLTLRASRNGRTISEDDAVILQNLIETGFQYWQPYPSTDSVTGWNLSKFHKDIGLSGWPHVG